MSTLAPIPIQYNGQLFGTLYIQGVKRTRRNRCTIALVFHREQGDLLELFRSAIQSFLRPINLQFSEEENRFVVTFVPITKVGKNPYPLFRKIAEGLAKQIFLRQGATV